MISGAGVGETPCSFAPPSPCRETYPKPFWPPASRWANRDRGRNRTGILYGMSSPERGHLAMRACYPPPSARVGYRKARGRPWELALAGSVTPWSQPTQLAPLVASPGGYSVNGRDAGERYHMRVDSPFRGPYVVGRRRAEAPGEGSEPRRRARPTHPSSAVSFHRSPWRPPPSQEAYAALCKPSIRPLSTPTAPR